MSTLTVYAFFLCTSIATGPCPSGRVFLLTMILLFMDKKILIYRIVVARAVFAQFCPFIRHQLSRILRFNPHASTDLEAYLRIERRDRS